MNDIAIETRPTPPGPDPVHGRDRAKPGQDASAAPFAALVAAASPQQGEPTEARNDAAPEKQATPHSNPNTGREGTTAPAGEQSEAARVAANAPELNTTKRGKTPAPSVQTPIPEIKSGPSPLPEQNQSIATGGAGDEVNRNDRLQVPTAGPKANADQAPILTAIDAAKGVEGPGKSAPLSFIDGAQETIEKTTKPESRAQLSTPSAATTAATKVQTELPNENGGITKPLPPAELPATRRAPSTPGPAGSTVATTAPAFDSDLPVTASNNPIVAEMNVSPRERIRAPRSPAEKPTSKAFAVGSTDGVASESPKTLGRANGAQSGAPSAVLEQALQEARNMAASNAGDTRPGAGPGNAVFAVPVDNAIAADNTGTQAPSVGSVDGVRLGGLAGETGTPAIRAGTAHLPVADQIAVQITRAVAGGQGQIRIRLHPAELGMIDVKLEMSDSGRLSTTIVVERPETLDLLQRDARSLEKALQQAGLDANKDSLNFSLRGDDNRGRFADAETRRDNGSDEDNPAASEPQLDESQQTNPAAMLRARGAIDVHV